MAVMQQMSVYDYTVQHLIPTSTVTPQLLHNSFSCCGFHASSVECLCWNLKKTHISVESAHKWWENIPKLYVNITVNILR